VSKINDELVGSNESDRLFDNLSLCPAGVASFSSSRQMGREPIQEVVEAKSAVLFPDFVLVGTETKT
jgi:hypothetical protein